MLNELEQAFEMVNCGSSVKLAEETIKRMRQMPDYPMLLLSHLNDSKTFQGKLRASIELKIWC